MLIRVGTAFEISSPLPPPLGNVLYLFTEALEFRLEFDDLVGQWRITGLRPHRIGFSQHFLDKKIELAANGLRPAVARHDVTKLRNMAPEPDQLFGYIESVGGDYDLLVQPGFVEQARILTDLLGAPTQSFTGGFDHQG
jgi:hypothetical protein